MLLDMASPLISPEALREQLGAIVLIDARPGPAAFADGHLPGALHADLERDLSIADSPAHDPARGGRHPLPSAAAFVRLVGQWGIGPDRDVVVYDAAGGANAAARCWWMFRSIGHGRVQVLDGGLPAALAAGLVVDSVPFTPRNGDPVIAAEPSWTLPTVDADTVEARRRSPAWKLLDVRSRERFRGDAEPIDPVSGHIPGAMNIPFTENLRLDGRFKSPAELRALYAGLLENADMSSLAVMCGSGVTACHTLLALEHAGLSGAALYVGSWSEWCRSSRQREPT